MSKLFIIFFISILFCQNLYCQQDEAAKYFELGVIHKKNRDYREAIGEFTKAISADSSYKPDVVYNERGNAFFALGIFDDAILDYSKSIENNPNYVASYCNRGSAYYNLRQFNEAVWDFSKVIELDPGFKSGIAYVFRASSNFYMAKFPEAIRDYSKAIEINPNDARVYNDRGNIYYLQDSYELARSDYEKASLLDSQGKAGKNARQKISLILKQERSGKKRNQEVLKKIDQLKNEWANELDNAGKAIAEKDFNRAKININNSASLAQGIKGLLSDNGLSTEKASAMEKLSLTYQNLNSIFKMLDSGDERGVDVSRLERLISESYDYLNQAEPNFKDAPFLEKICQEIRKGLDSVSAQLSSVEN